MKLVTSSAIFAVVTSLLLGCASDVEPESEEARPQLASDEPDLEPASLSAPGQAAASAASAAASDIGNAAGCVSCGTVYGRRICIAVACK
jgi:hypothetical protein